MATVGIKGLYNKPAAMSYRKCLPLT